MSDPNSHTIWILGAGKFGTLAARRICRAWPQCAVTLIDSEPTRPDDIPCSRIRTVHADGIQFLAQAFSDNDLPDWIVPAAPVHVAFEWMRSMLASTFAVQPVPVPQLAADGLPNPMPGGPGTLYVSNASWICPDDCAEPPSACTVTGEPHGCNVYEKLQKLKLKEIVSVCIRSRQLLPGVGGYSPQDLKTALEKVKTADQAILLSTACRCHAVLDAFRLDPL